MFALRIMAIAVALLLAGLVAPVAAQDDKGESETDLLRNKITQLEGDLADTRERRNYYQDRTVELKAENAALTEEVAALEARIAELEGQDAPAAAPPATSMSADERSYLVASSAIMLAAGDTLSDAADITSNPDFITDPVLWYVLIEAMRPMHDHWAAIQALTPPSRLTDLHQAYVDVLYNFDQAATQYEIGVTTVDVAALDRGTAHLGAGTEALNRATRLIGEYEDAADIDVSDQLI